MPPPLLGETRAVGTCAFNTCAGETPLTLEKMWWHYASLLSDYRAQPSRVAFSSLPHADSVPAELFHHARTARDGAKEENDATSAEGAESGVQKGARQHQRPRAVKWEGARRELWWGGEKNVRELGCSRHDTLVWLVDSLSTADDTVRALMFSPWDLPNLKTGQGTSKHLSCIQASGITHCADMPGNNTRITHTQILTQTGKQPLNISFPAPLRLTKQHQRPACISHPTSQACGEKMRTGIAHGSQAKCTETYL